jgi:uracil permease
MLKTNIVIGLITTAIIVFLMLFTKGIISILSVLIGIISGSIIYFIIYGYQTYNGGFFSIPAFSAPKFSINAIVLIAPVVLATLLEHIGDISAN